VCDDPKRGSNSYAAGRRILYGRRSHSFKLTHYTPISIPRYPIETASSGIKARSIWRRVGSYLVPNNLSANAHGNGYTNPNIYIATVIESVEVDGGAFKAITP
jgi:hypothetical protein